MITNDQAVSYGTLIALIITTVLSQVNAWKTKQRDQAVNIKLDTNNAQRSAKLDVIHSLVNSGMATQLSRVVDLAQRLYSLAQTPEAQRDLELARAAFDAHMVRQNAVDASIANGSRPACPPNCPYAGPAISPTKENQNAKNP